MVTFAALFHRAASLPLDVGPAASVVKCVMHGHRCETRLLTAVPTDGLVNLSHRFLRGAVAEQWPTGATQAVRTEPQLFRMRYVLTCLRMLSTRFKSPQTAQGDVENAKLAECYALIRSEVRTCASALKRVESDKIMDASNCAQLAFAAFVVEDAESCQIALQTLAESAHSSPTTLLAPDVARVVAETSSRLHSSPHANALRRLSARALAPVLEQAIEHAGGGLRCIALPTHEAIVVMVLSPRLVEAHVDELLRVLDAFPADSNQGLEAADRVLSVALSAYPELLCHGVVAPVVRAESDAANSVLRSVTRAGFSTGDFDGAMERAEHAGSGYDAVKIEETPATAHAVQRVAAAAIQHLARARVPLQRSRILKALVHALRVMPYVPADNALHEACRSALRVILKNLARTRPGDDWFRGSLSRVMHFCDPEQDWELLEWAMRHLSDVGFPIVASDLYRNASFARPAHSRRLACSIAPALCVEVAAAMRKAGASTQPEAYAVMRAEEIIEQGQIASDDAHSGWRRILAFTSQTIGVLEILQFAGSDDVALVNALVVDALVSVGDSDPRTVGRLLRVVALLDIRVRGVHAALQRVLCRKLLGTPSHVLRVVVSTGCLAPLARGGRKVGEPLKRLVLESVEAVIDGGTDSDRVELYRVLADRLLALQKEGKRATTLSFRAERFELDRQTTEELRTKSRLPLELQRLLLRVLLRCLAGEYKRTRLSGTVASAEALSLLVRGAATNTHGTYDARAKFVTGAARLVKLYASLADPEQRARGLTNLTKGFRATKTPRLVLLPITRAAEECVLDQHRRKDGHVDDELRRLWLELVTRANPGKHFSADTNERRRLELIAAAPFSSPPHVLHQRARAVNECGEAFEMIAQEAEQSTSRGTLAAMLWNLGRGHN